MAITKKTVANKLAAYLGHRLTLGDLVEWAEHAMQEGTFEVKNAKIPASAIGRIGVADVRAFGLAWEDCEQILKQLGYLTQGSGSGFHVICETWLSAALPEYSSSGGRAERKRRPGGFRYR